MIHFGAHTLEGPLGNLESVKLKIWRQKLSP